MVAAGQSATLWRGTQVCPSRVEAETKLPRRHAPNQASCTDSSQPERTMTYDPPVPWSPSGPNEQPSTLPKDSQGQAINEDRRARKAREAEFEKKHGRKMSKKDRKRQRGS